MPEAREMNQTMSCLFIGLQQKIHKYPMNKIADFITRAAGTGEPSARIAGEIKIFRHDFFTLFYCHDHPYP
ncbi:hypothetical protein [Legionella spiritensis]|uniref:hypothetical protein n=1 Tax=Legionella spiritensis TaxID=452 RepID=UPI00073121CB|nr:hypothetical protein [Legionella spiritensis]